MTAGNSAAGWVAGIALLLVLLAGLWEGAERDRRFREGIFAEEVLLGREFPDEAGSPVVLRWPDGKQIGVRLAAGTAMDGALLNSVIGELNRALDGTGVVLLRDDRATDIEVYLQNVPMVLGPGDRVNVITTPPGKALFWVYTEDDGTIREALVLVSETFPPETKRRMLLEELTQSLGPVNDSRLIPDSIFHETLDDVTNVARLSEQDIRLLRFLYQNLTPGQDVNALRRAFATGW